MSTADILKKYGVAPAKEQTEPKADIGAILKKYNATPERVEEATKPKTSPIKYTYTPGGKVEEETFSAPGHTKFGDAAAKSREELGGLRLPTQARGSAAVEAAHSALGEQKTQAEAELNKARGALSFAQDSGYDADGLRPYEDRVKAAQDAVAALESRRDALRNEYYQRENTEQLQKLQGDNAALEQYQNVKNIGEDMKKVAALMSGFDGSAEAVRDRAYIAQKYGLTERDVAGRTDRLRQLYQELETSQTNGKKALEKAGYRYDRMEGYQKTQEDAERYQARQEATERLAREHPVAASAGSLLLSPFQGVDFAKKAVQAQGREDIQDYVPLNPYDMDVTNLVSTVRGTVSKELAKKYDWEIFGQNVAAFLYQTGMGVGDSAIQVAALGPAATLFMGASAASNEAKEIMERGGNNAQVFWGGLAAGAAETIFEYVSIENLLKPKDVAGWKSFLKETMKQAGTEASEEVFTELANIYSDAAIMKEKSNWAGMIREYMDQGMTREEAEQRAWLDCVEQVFWAGAGGALSGAMMGGVVNAYNGTMNNRLNREVGSDYRATGEETVRGLIDQGMKSAEGTEAHRLAQELGQKYFGGRNLTDAEIGALVRANDTAISVEEQGQKQPQEESQTLGKVEEKPAEKRTIQQEIEVQMEAGQREETPQKRTLQEEIQTQFEARAKEKTAPTEERTTMEGVAEDVQEERPRLEWAGSEQRAEAQPAKPAEGGVQVSDGDRGRPFGDRAREQIGRLEQRRQDGTPDQSRTAGERRTRAEGLRLEKQSSEGLGLQRGTENANLTVMPEGIWDDSQRSTAERVLRETGKPVTYVLGGMEIRTSDGGVRRARGVITSDRVILQADHGRVTVEQIADHEMFHDMAKNDRGLRSAVRDAIVEQYGEAEYAKMVERYIRGLRGVYELDRLMLGQEYESYINMVEEELLADAYAGIDAFSAKGSKYTETARDAVQERDGQRSIERAGEESGDGSDARYSTDEFFTKNVEEWDKDGRPEGERFILGSTSNVLQGLGAMENDIYMNAEKISSILSDHPEMTLEEIKRIPELLDDPVLILKSKGTSRGGQNTRLVIFGTVKAQNGQPVMSVLDLRPREGRLVVDDMQKVNSAYTRENAANYITSSEVLYVDKKRTAPLLRTVGLQIRPTELQRSGSMGSISYDKQNVNIEGVPFSDVFNDNPIQRAFEKGLRGETEEQYSTDDDEPQSAREYAQRQKEAQREQQKKGPEESRPIIAKRDFRNTMMGLFSIPEGQRGEMGRLIDRYADRLLKTGELTQEDRDALFDRLYDEGVMTIPADTYFASGREAVQGGRIYVRPELRADFGDDWNTIRRRAFAAGVHLTSNMNDPGVDVWNMQLAEQFPGIFDPQSTDEYSMLEHIVQLAEEGADEKMGLAEYARLLAGQEGISESEILDNMERQMDWALRTFAEKADLEIKLRDRTGYKMAQERAKRQESARKAKENRELRELQQKTLRQLQWLQKNQRVAPEEMKARFQEVLGDIDTLAIGAADATNWSKKYDASWGDLAEMYKAAKENDPNFLPSKELQRIVDRLDKEKIADLDPAALMDLYKAAVGLRTEYYNAKKVINDEEGRLFAEVYAGAKKEIEDAAGGYRKSKAGAKLDQFLNLEQMTPMNVLDRMAGWDTTGTFHTMARQLEQGERKMRDYRVRAERLLEDYIQTHEDFIKKADGQGKDAVWYEIEVPELLELGMGSKPIFGETVKVWMTPMQKVHLYLESKNYDNLRHIAGGRTFADKELYSQGKRQEAFAQGRTIRLAPETVKKIVSDLTAEEMELANLLERYYNGFAAGEINKVSNVLYGYDKAVTTGYAPIYTNRNYVQSEIGVFDVTAEGVGNLKARVVSKNPSYNISALDAFERHVDQTARFVGMSIPAQNWTTLLNYRESNNSMGDVITHKWGEQGKKYIEDLLTTLQGGGERASRGMSDKLLSQYITAVFGANPGIVLKQAASFPQFGAVLGFENAPTPGQLRQISEDLINTYTSELAYRKLGYATPETATLKNNPGKLDTNKVTKFLFRGGAITWMDATTVTGAWAWAENKVRRENPGLELGTQEEIAAGESPFYKKVAEEWENAVSLTQPMYDTMHRANIMQGSSGVMRAFTMFKTVPLQQANTLRRAFGELQYAKQTGDQAAIKRASKGVGAAVTATLASVLMLEGIEFLNQLVKNRGKKYRDDDDELTAGSVAGAMARQSVSDLTGMVIGGEELTDILANWFMGEKWYGIEIPGGEQLNDVIDATSDAVATIQKLVTDGATIAANGGDLGTYWKRYGADYAGAAKEIAEKVAMYAGSLPVENVEKYIMGITQNVSPELYTAMQDAFDTPTKTDLSSLKGGALEVRTKHILKNRGVELEDDTVSTLTQLYEAGFKEVIPSDTPANVSVGGEERKLNAYQKQTYDLVWGTTVRDGLEELMSRGIFREASEAAQEKMVSKLYTYAAERAKETVFNDYESSTTTWKMAMGEIAGIGSADYIAVAGSIAAHDENGTVTQAEAKAGLDDVEGLSELQKAIMWQMQDKRWKGTKNPYNAKAGEKVAEALNSERDLGEEIMRQLMENWK